MPPHYIAEKVAQHRSSLVYLVHRFDEATGECWYYVRVHKLKLPEFLRMCALSKTFDLTAYGEIISSGKGDVAPAYDAPETIA